MSVRNCTRLLLRETSGTDFADYPGGKEADRVWYGFNDDDINVSASTQQQ